MLMIVLADATRRRLTPGELLEVALPLIGILLAGALVIYLFDRWRKRRAARTDLCDPNDQLSHFRSLYEKGEMIRDEYEKVRALLTVQLRMELKLSAPKAAEPAPAAPEPPPVETNVQTAPPAPQSLPPAGPPTS